MMLSTEQIYTHLNDLKVFSLSLKFLSHDFFHDFHIQISRIAMYFDRSCLNTINDFICLVYQ